MLTALERARRARRPGAATPRQVVDDWASVLTQRAASARGLRARARPGRSAATRSSAPRRLVPRPLRRAPRLARGEPASQAELDAEDDAAPAARLAAARRPARPAPATAAALPPRRDRRGAGLLAARGAVLLDCLDESRSITLAGDTQQHVVQDGGFTSWTRVLRPPRARRHRGQHAATSAIAARTRSRASPSPCSATCARTTPRR